MQLTILQSNDREAKDGKIKQIKKGEHTDIIL